MKDCCILLQSDNNYAPYMGVTLVSLYENNKHRDEIDTFIIDDHLSEQNKKRTRNLAQAYQRNISFIEAENIVKFLEASNMPKLRGISYTTYLKVFVIERFLDKYERVLYLDSDLVITEKLDELFTMDLGSDVCAMALDLEPEIRTFLGIDEPERWFNAGVILFNTSKWVSDKCLEQISTFMQHNKKKLFFHEQDIINYLFRNKIRMIDNRYNLYTVFKYLGIDATSYIYGWSDTLRNMERKSFEVPCIYHCFPIMGKRPWHKGYRMDNETGWSRYLKMTPWSDYALLKYKSSILTKIQTILYKLLPMCIYRYAYRFIYMLQAKKTFVSE